jgi:tetratricopeptide (TPR) repeat protein
MIRPHWFLCISLIGSSAIQVSLGQAEDALAQAVACADRYAWGDALPMFVQAEQERLEAGDTAGAAFARVGRIRASVKEQPAERIYDALNREIKRAPWKPDSPMRLSALLLKADVEFDIDALSVRPFNADQRRKDWQEILVLSQKLGDRNVEARARGELGLVKVLGGDPVGSEAIGTALWQAKDAGNVRNELRFRTAIARLYLSAGRSHDALGHLKRAVELAEQGQALSYFPAWFEEAVGLLDERRLEDALPLVEHCAAQARITSTPANMAQALYLQARVSLESGRRDQSVNLLKQALELASNAGYHRLISIASLEISRIYRQQGEVWKAVGSSEVGLQASREVGDYTEVISQIHNQGILQADQGRFVQADHLYGGAVRALNALLAKFTSAYARAYFVSRMSDLYSDYFSLALLKLKDPPKAFAILEQARGRSISDSLRGRWTDPDREADGTLRSPFEKELARAQSQLWYKEEPQKLRKTLSDIFDLGQRLGPSRESGRHSVEAQTFPPVPLAEIQKALYPEEVILEYVLGEHASTCLAISRAGVQGVPLAPRHVIEEAVTRYREEILQGTRAEASAHALYDLLLAPIAGLAKQPRMTIVADGLLHLLPFEAILAPSGKMLIETHLIDYSPSATVTWLLRKIPARQATRLKSLGVGDAQYPSFDESGGVYFASRLHPARLPGTRAEVSSIARVLRKVSETSTLLGADVSESAVKFPSLRCWPYHWRS